MFEHLERKIDEELTIKLNDEKLELLINKKRIGYLSDYNKQDNNIVQELFINNKIDILFSLFDIFLDNNIQADHIFKSLYFYNKTTDKYLVSDHVQVSYISHKLLKKDRFCQNLNDVYIITDKVLNSDQKLDHKSDESSTNELIENVVAYL